MIRKESKNAVRKVRHVRVRERVIGTHDIPRLCVYRSNANISAQIIDDQEGITLVSASSLELKDKNVNMETAKKVGSELAKKATKAGIKKVVFDRGGYLYHGRVAALADAAREGGLEF